MDMWSDSANISTNAGEPTKPQDGPRSDIAMAFGALGGSATICK